MADIENKRKYNILMVHNYYQLPGGEDSVVANEKKMLEMHGNKVILYSRNNSELNNMNFFHKLLLPFIFIFNPKTFKDIKLIIKKNNIDIVHVHNTLALISPSVYYAALFCKIPIIQTVHNFRLLCPNATFFRDEKICEDCLIKGLKCAIKHNCYRNNKLQTIACVLSTKIHRYTGIYKKINFICLTEFNKKKLLHLNGIKINKLFVKPNFIEDSSKDVVPYDKRDNQFIFVGRLEKLKGINILFETWKYLGNSAPKLVVCGKGPMDKWCRTFLENNPKCKIEMKGLVSNEEVMCLIGKSKALILPTQCYEGLPMTIVEAYSLKTPVIGSDLGNVGTLIENNITGFKFQQDSIQSIAKAIEDFNLTCQKQLSENAYMKYYKEFSPQKNYEILYKIYSSIVLKDT